MKTTLRIGFTNTYYTLWSISVSYNYTTIDVNNSTQVTGGYCTTHYNYIQNLSTDLNKAIEKAKVLGVTDFEVDNELYGRNSSWDVRNEVLCHLPKNVCSVFQFGKYDGKNILDCTDINYLLWYFNETKNIYAKEVLVKNGYIEYNDDVLSSDEYNKVISYNEKRTKNKAELERIKDSDYGHIVVKFNKNLNSYGISNEYNIPVLFKNYKTLSYNGYNYGLPLIDGNAKKIKGKELVLLVRVIEYNDEEILEVVKIKSIKDVESKKMEVFNY